MVSCSISCHICFNCWVRSSAFPSYTRHARLDRDLVIWLANEAFDKLTVAKQFSECRRLTDGLQVTSNDDQRGLAVKTNDTPDHNSWLRACVTCNIESRIGTPPWTPPGTSSMIVRTKLEAGFIA
ncbi:hypothetical protein TNCV_2664851 [Trichonephila clavipes]|nr:hypothetical protein TNCV_2664851 [Trichonephila clavipes]